METPNSTTHTGVAGEFFVLAELARRNAVAAMTLGNTKSVDILLGPETTRPLRLEVKTARTKPGRCRTHHKEEICFQWQLGEKHEKIKDRRTFYVLVNLPKPPDPPRFFIVPTRVVAEYVKWEHKYWLTHCKKPNPKDTNRRVFRIPKSKWKRYEDGWERLGVR